MKRFKIFLLFILVIFLLASVPFVRAESIGLGGIFDLSGGPGGVWGRTEKNSFILAIDDFKKRHPDVKVHYKIEDSNYSNLQSVTAFKKLTEVDKLSFIVGPTWETFVAIMPLCEQRKIICFAPSNHGYQFYNDTEPLRFAFTAYFDERDYAREIAGVVNTEKPKNLTVVSALTPFFDTLVRAFEEQVTVKPYAIERVKPDEQDFKSLIARIKRPTDALYLILDPGGQHLSFLTQWSQLRAERPTIYSADVISFETGRESIVRLGFPIRYSLPKINQEHEAYFIKKYEKRYQLKPESPSGSITYDETMILLNCIKKVGPETELVGECIRKTENYQGFSGIISFSGNQSVSGREFEVQTLQ